MISPFSHFFPLLPFSVFLCFSLSPSSTLWRDLQKLGMFLALYHAWHSAGFINIYQWTVMVCPPGFYQNRQRAGYMYISFCLPTSGPKSELKADWTAGAMAMKSQATCPRWPHLPNSQETRPIGLDLKQGLCSWGRLWPLKWTRDNNTSMAAVTKTSGGGP